MTLKTSPLIFVFFIFMITGCDQKQTSLDFLEQEMKQIGYEGTFERPKGVIQKTALSLMGVNDVIVFNSPGSTLLIAQLSEGNNKDMTEQLESLLSIAEPYISEKDKDNLHRSKEMIRERSIQHNQIVLMWQDQKPEDLVKLIQRNY
ncbi:MAG: hypothetical protein ACOCX0_02815 [Bacteroidota bacterium]